MEAKLALNNPSPVDPSLLTEIDIACCWAELQLGDPSRAVADLRIAIVQLPYSIGAWIGVVRALRLLGLPGDAEVVLNRLLGRHGQAGRPAKVRLPRQDQTGASGGPTGQERASTWLKEEGVPDLSLIHSSTLHNEIGWCYVDQDRHQKAKAEFEAAIERSAYRLSAHRGLITVTSAGMADTETVLAERRAHLERSLPKDAAPLVRDLRLEAGRVLIGTGQLALAEAHFEAVLDELWSDPPGHRLPRHRTLYAMADAYLDERLHEPADELLQRVEAFLPPEQTSRDERLALLCAKSFLVQQRPHDAIRRLERYCLADTSTTPDPSSFGNPVAHHSHAIQLAYLIAHFEARNFRTLDELLISEETPTASTDGVPAPPRSDLIRLVRGWAKLSESELPTKTTEQALELVQPLYQELEDEPDRRDTGLVDTQHYLAIVEARMAVLGTMPQQRENRTALAFGKAVERLEEVVRRRPRDGGALRDLGALYLNLDRFDLAAATLRRVEVLDGQDARIHLLKGVLKYRQGDRLGAVVDFRSAVAWDPADHVHHRALILALLENGDTREALGCRRRRTPVGPGAVNDADPHPRRSDAGRRGGGARSPGPSSAAPEHREAAEPVPGRIGTGVKGPAGRTGGTSGQGGPCPLGQSTLGESQEGAGLSGCRRSSRRPTGRPYRSRPGH